MTPAIEDLREIADQIDTTIAPTEREEFFMFSESDLMEFVTRVLSQYGKGSA